MAGRVRAWRSAFGPLRRGSADGTTVQDLLAQAPALSRSVHEVSAVEVVGDVVLLLEVVSKLNDAESRSVCSRICRLVADITSSGQLEFKPAACAVQVCQFFRQIVERYSQTSMEDGRQASNDAVVEAVNALGYFINVNGQLLSFEEVNAVLLSFVPLMNYQRTLPKDARTKKGGGYDCVFIAIANVFTRAGAMISEGTWKTIVQTFRKLLDHMSSQPLEDSASSRYYATVLRSVHIVLTDAKGSLDDNVAGLVASLRVFIGYGLSATRSKTRLDHVNPTSISTTGTKEKTTGSSLYRPPHLRARLSDSAESSSSVEETEKRPMWSDSEQSDNESDNFRSSKARTNAILSIQAIARTDPKSLHAHWSLLLPTHNVLVPRMYQPTLLTSLLFDPASKTRIAAACAVSALLEGPAKAFLQVADYKLPGKTASYTTLSGSLGQMIVELYRGLLYSVSNESQSAVLLAVLKSLSLLVSSSPFDRLPQRLLCDVITTVYNKISQSADQTITVSGLSCLSAVFGASSGLSDVVHLLVEPLPDPSSKGENFLLPGLISLVRSSPSSTVRIESLQALKAAIHVHISLASLYWSAFSGLVLEIINNEAESRPENLVDEKTVYHALKVLDESLRAISGFKGAEDIFDIPLSSPAPSLLPQPTKLLTNLERPPNEMTGEVLNGEVLGLSHWLETIQTFLPLTLQHPAPMVRAAALTCFAGLTTAVYSNLSEAHQAYILTNVVEAALKDGTPSVRTAACRALGVIVSCGEFIERKDRIRSAVTTVQGTISDPALAVRITSSWALANICDAFCKAAQKGISAEPDMLNSLADIALKAAKDSDKVRANAVRALGNLAKFVDFAENGSCAWLSRMVQTLVSCITTGNVKVQWNVCHALGNLFLNRSICLSEMPWSSSVFSILLLLLRDSGNFKIRIHAASAMAVPSSRNAFGESYGDVLRGLVHGLESLDSDERAPPGSFKYISTLSEQLTSTCLRVLSFASPDDYIILKDFLHKRATFLHNWLQSIISSTSSYGNIESNYQIKMELAGRAARVLSELYGHGGEKSLEERFQALFTYVK